jgi:DNA-binding MarR family transcriptional regulator
MNVLQKAQKLDRLLQQLRRSKLYKRPHHTDLNDADMMVLFCIGFCEENQKVKLSDISQRLHVTLPAVTHKVNMLETSGLIERKPSHDDKRVTYVNLTPKGNSILNETKETYYKHLFEVMDQLGEEETEVFMNILTKITGLYQ